MFSHLSLSQYKRLPVGFITIFILMSLMLMYRTQAAANSGYNYGEALQKSIYFYRQQRSGDLPQDFPVIWRGDSAVNDGADVGLDLSGGYYDAGDHVKFGIPAASTITVLSWSVYEYEQAFADAGQLEEILDAIRWGTDYFIKAHPQPNVFYHQVGDGSDDHGWWGPAEVIEEAMARPSRVVTLSDPGSTVVGGTAAALASAAIIFQASDPAYAALCLQHAQELFDFAWNTQSDAGYSSNFYPSYNGFWDELSAAATWLYMATGDPAYLVQAEQAAENWETVGRRDPVIAYEWTHSWDDMHYMGQILLARLTQNPLYIESVERNLDYWQPGGGVTYTAGGLAWLDQWGSLRYAANAAFLAFVWADTPLGDPAKKAAYQAFAENQINYILGDNPAARSYLMGFGTNPPINPHHRTAHGPWYDTIQAPIDNEHILLGALVGGPDANDNYDDDRADYQQNEVALDYNAGLVASLAKMYTLYGGNPLTDFPQNYFKPESARRDAYFVRARIDTDGDTAVQITTQLSNRSAWPATVEDTLSFRYFFDLSETYAAGYTVNDITVSLGNHEGAVLSGPHLWSGTIYYVELDFTGTKIFPGGRPDAEKLAIFEISGPTAAAWDSSNDWSRQGLTATPFTYEPVDLTGKTDFIPVYRASSLLFGQEPSGEPQPTAVPVPVYVSAIDMTVVNPNGPFYRADAVVTVLNDQGNPVANATVQGTFSGATSGPVFGVTNAAGQVVVSSVKIKDGGTWTFCVDAISGSGLVYQPGLNVETCDIVSGP